MKEIGQQGDGTKGVGGGDNRAAKVPGTAPDAEPNPAPADVPASARPGATSSDADGGKRPVTSATPGTTQPDGPDPATAGEPSLDADALAAFARAIRDSAPAAGLARVRAAVVAELAAGEPRRQRKRWRDLHDLHDLRGWVWRAAAMLAVAGVVAVVAAVRSRPDLRARDPAAAGTVAKLMAEPVVCPHGGRANEAAAGADAGTVTAAAGGLEKALATATEKPGGPDGRVAGEQPATREPTWPGSEALREFLKHPDRYQRICHCQPVYSGNLR